MKLGLLERRVYFVQMNETHETSPLVHVFICTRTKEKGESCGPKGGAELRDRLKHWTKEAGISKTVKVTASLCLSHCEEGITACVYPQGRWFVKVDKDHDYENLKSQILEMLKEAQ
jgi:predicted metal-binding protein